MKENSHKKLEELYKLGTLEELGRALKINVNHLSQVYNSLEKNPYLKNTKIVPEIIGSSSIRVFSVRVGVEADYRGDSLPKVKSNQEIKNFFDKIVIPHALDDIRFEGFCSGISENPKIKEIYCARAVTGNSAVGREIVKVRINELNTSS